MRNFLISNALFWFDHYHVDGLRVDAVASMLYLDYGKTEGEWIPNRYGGNENLEALDFLRLLNEKSMAQFPGVTDDRRRVDVMADGFPAYLPRRAGLRVQVEHGLDARHAAVHVAEIRSTASYHHNQITFGMLYAFSENFVLPFSHDEVVHGKGSMIGKMPGDDWQKFANLRLLYGYMFGHPGKKLLFMGGEFGQWREWNHDASLEWHLLTHDLHGGLQRWVRDLNTFYRGEPALYEMDSEPAGSNGSIVAITSEA